MKFQPETGDGVNWVTRHAAGQVWIGTVAFGRSIVVPWVGAVLDWDAPDAAALRPAHFERIAELAPEVVLYGSGASLRFPSPALLRSLYARGIGVETMDTAAACRTYNVLAGEGRRVVAALIVP